MKPAFSQFKCACGPKDSPQFIRHGSFYRTSDSRLVRRFRCVKCGHTFSRATFHPCFKQHKRRANFQLYKLLCSNNSQRRCARILNLSRNTVERKFRFLAERCRIENQQYLKQFEESPLEKVQFDEVETFEHSILKAVSIALVVSMERQILVTEVAQMPTKGPLAQKSRNKYGPRRDDRPKALEEMFEKLKPIVKSDAVFKSDKNPMYPSHLFRAFPNAKHETTKGGRSAVVGQGELKKKLWDPIFSLNHTAAMLRANINRLIRRTWCTTKTLRGLRDHLAIYTHYHNTVLLAA